MSMSKRLRQAVVLLLLFIAACGGPGGTDGDATSKAAPLSDHEDPVCGMFVREQPAPRGQLVHRDGSRFFLCSLGDLLVHLEAPSPHGNVQAVFVEVMKAGENPKTAKTGEHPWVRAEEALYVVGVDRPGIMGEPVLAYASRAEADTAMELHGGEQVLDFNGLRRWWNAIQASR